MATRRILLARGSVPLLAPSSTHTPLTAPGSARDRHVARDGDELGREPAHQLDVPLTDGGDHARGRVRLLRGALSARLALLPGLLPRDGGA